MANDLQPYYERLYAGARELYSFGYSNLDSRDQNSIVVMGSRDRATGFIRSLEIAFKPTVLELLVLGSRGARVKDPLTEVVITPDGYGFQGKLYFWPRDRKVTLGRSIGMAAFPLAGPLLKRVSGQMDHLQANTLFKYRVSRDPGYPIFPQALSA